MAELTRRMLLQFYAPASVVTDLKGNILYVYGETGKYLRPAPGQATLNVIDMAREGLQLELRAAIQAVNQGTPGSKPGADGQDQRRFSAGAAQRHECCLTRMISKSCC